MGILGRKMKMLMRTMCISIGVNRNGCSLAGKRRQSGVPLSREREEENEIIDLKLRDPKINLDFVLKF